MHLTTMPAGRRLVIASLAVAASIVALIVLLPPATSDLASHPRPITDYDSAVASIDRRRTTDQSIVAPLGESIVRLHGHRTATAVLLLHGFTNSPRQFDSLADLFYRDGDNVYVPRLPRHAERGGTASNLSRLTADDLRGTSDSAVDEMRGLGDTVVVVGLSLGGTMAAWIAQFRAEPRRVVVIAPVIALANVPSIFDGPVRNLADRIPGWIYKQGTDSAAPDRELGWSSRAVGEMLRLGLSVQRDAVHHPPRTKSIAVLLNGADRTIAVEPVLALACRWRSHGARVDVFRIDAALGLPHDVIDPRQPVRRLDVVYPLVEALAHGMPVDVRFVSRVNQPSC